MTDHDELIAKVAKLEAKIEELEKQLKDNTKADERRHKEWLEQQQKQHGENMTWNKAGGIGGILTGVVGIIGVITWIIKLLGGNKEEKKKEISQLW